MIRIGDKPQKHDATRFEQSRDHQAKPYQAENYPKTARQDRERKHAIEKHLMRQGPADIQKGILVIGKQQHRHDDVAERERHPIALRDRHGDDQRGDDPIHGIDARHAAPQIVHQPAGPADIALMDVKNHKAAEDKKEIHARIAESEQLLRQHIVPDILRQSQHAAGMKENHQTGCDAAAELDADQLAGALLVARRLF